MDCAGWGKYKAIERNAVGTTAADRGRIERDEDASAAPREPKAQGGVAHGPQDARGRPASAT